MTNPDTPQTCWKTLEFTTGSDAGVSVTHLQQTHRVRCRRNLRRLPHCEAGWLQPAQVCKRRIYLATASLLSSVSKVFSGAFSSAKKVFCGCMVKVISTPNASTPIEIRNGKVQLPVWSIK